MIKRSMTGIQLIVATLALSLTGCASQHRAVPELPDVSSEEYQYVIGAGDSLEIFVWGYEDLTVNVPVRPDGKLSTKLAEDMQASGKTPSELARDIEIEYAKYVKAPVVSVSVSSFVGSPEQQIKVVGGGFKPKSVPYKSEMTMLDLMIEIGGLGEFSNGNKSVLIRKSKGKRESFRVRLNDLVNKGDISADIPLIPGDIVMIPESWF